MFLDFFYRLRENGLDVSPNEWITFLKGLQKGLHGQSFTGFYRLARAVLTRSEADFDRFDQTFADVFRDVPLDGEIPEEILEFLRDPTSGREEDHYGDQLMLALKTPERETFAEIFERMKKVLEVQDGEHNGGKKWVGTKGHTGYGNSGWFPGGIRIEGKGMYRSAVSVATERSYRDFRTDRVIDERQYQLAFRKLRNFSSLSPGTEKELDIDGTVMDTGKNAGMLRIRMKNPRKNSVKLLLLMDSGGSMEAYSRFCSTICHAATKSNYFKELKVYYFHNCIFESLYTSPEIRLEHAVGTDWVLANYGSEYKVIIVGDAAMEPHELTQRRYNWLKGEEEESTVLDWLLRFKSHYPYLVWLNPVEFPVRDSYMTRTHVELAKVFPMYHLTVDGLETAIRRLMSR